VLDVDVERAVVVVGDESRLATSAVQVDGVTWSHEPSPLGSDVLVQASAHGVAQPAVIESSVAREFVVRWMTPQRRVAPGQSVVLYDATNRFVLGGGTAR
jgi:tRNA-specific 2-thiouridylase